jgi:hypothetical protein
MESHEKLWRLRKEKVMWMENVTLVYEQRAEAEKKKLAVMQTEMASAIDALHQVGKELRDHPEAIEQCIKVLQEG